MEAVIPRPGSAVGSPRDGKASHPAATAAGSTGFRSRDAHRRDREAGAQHEVDVQRGGVAESPDRNNPTTGRLSEDDAAPLTRSRARAIDQWRRALVPPIVDRVGQPSAGPDEWVGTGSPDHVDRPGPSPPGA